LVRALDFSQNGTIFSVLRSSFSDAIPLIRMLNVDLCEFSIDDCQRFEEWQKVARNSLLYLVDLSQIESCVLRSFPSDLVCCQSIPAMIHLIFRMYTVESSLYQNVNRFLRCFPISMVPKFQNELKGILRYIYLLQSSIQYHSNQRPLTEDLLVYRGLPVAEFLPLYESLIEDVVIWPGFTSTSTDRNLVLHEFMNPEDGVLFEIELHAGDIAALIQHDSEHEMENEVLIAASTGFKVLSVCYDALVDSPFVGETQIRVPVVRLSYFHHWYDVDLDQRPATVLVGEPC
jgi:hypothetical protein